MHLSSSTARRAAIAMAAALFLLILFSVPYMVPMKPSVSASFAYGYNNRAATLIVILAAVLLAFSGVKLPAPDSLAGRPVTRRDLRWASAGTLAITAILYLLTRRLEGFGESVYLIDRIKMALEGHAPYRDFEYAYGAAFIYLPVWMVRWLHLPVGDAYGLFWLLVSLLGVVLLYKTIEWIDEPAVDKRRLFLLLWALTQPALMSTGVNYSLLRFLLPCFFAMLLYRRLAPADYPKSQPLALLSPVPMFALLLLVSPELALTFGFGMACYLAVFGHLRTGKNLLWFALMLASCVALTVVAGRFDVLLTLMAFGTGGLNFPLMPAPHILLLLFSVALCALYCGQRMRLRRPSSLAILIAASAASLAAALGRCDPGHVLLNPFGITIASSFIAAGIPRVWRWFMPAMLLVFLILSLPMGLFATGTMLFKAALPSLLSGEPDKHETGRDRWILARMTASLGAEKGRQKFDNLRALAHAGGHINIAATFGAAPQTVFNIPFGFTATRFGTLHSPLLDEGYYFEITNVITPESVDRKIAELASHPDRPLLIMPEMEEYCRSTSSPSSVSVDRGIETLFLYPYRSRVVHPENLVTPICTYIDSHYRLQQAAMPEHFGYAVWAPLPGNLHTATSTR